MQRLSAAFAILMMCAVAASAKITDVEPGLEFERSGRGNEVLWFDDIEGNVDGWYSVSFWTWGCPRFHLDTYMAYEDSLSWWCGSFDYDADGGYGNSWDERLNMPVIDWTGYAYPVLTFAFRCDSEASYDFTYVQAESNGVFVNLNYGYDGTRPWLDLGLYGYVVRRHDNPFVGRLRFVSDGAWSDEDGLYCSTGGAVMVDENIVNLVNDSDWYKGGEIIDTTNWFEYPVILNLSEYAGNSSVRIAWHYYFNNETGISRTPWWVDDVTFTGVPEINEEEEGNGEPSGVTPGFELVLAFLAIAMVCLILLRRKSGNE